MLARVSPRAWWYLLAAGGAVLAARPLIPDGTAYEVWYQLFAAMAIAGMVVGIVANAPRRRLPWLLLTGGLVASFAGDLVFLVASASGREVPYPSVADALYLTGYPLQAVGLLLLVRAQTVTRDRAAGIDTATFAIGLAAACALPVHAIVTDPAGGGRATAVSLAYLIADVGLVAVMARMVIAVSWRLPAVRLLGAGFALNLVGDVLYAVGSTDGWYRSGHPVDLLWPAAYLLWAAAALHPSMRALSVPAAQTERPLGRARFAVLLAAGLVAPAVMIAGSLRDQWLTTLLGAAASTTVVALLAVRLTGLVNRHLRLVGYERLLRATAADLLPAADRDDVARVASATARALAGGGSRWAALVLPDGDGTERVVGAPETVCGPDRAAVMLAIAAARGGSRPDVALVPVTGGAGPLATLAVQCPDDCDALARESLSTLALQVATALDRIALTDDLLEHRSAERFQALVRHSADVILIMDRDLTIRYHTPSTETMLGYSGQELVGRPLRALLADADAGDVMTLVGEIARRPGATSRRETELRGRGGRSRTVALTLTNLLDDPNVGGLVATAHDVTDRKVLERQLVHQAFHDPLTGLANRELFRDRVTHALTRGRRAGPTPIVLFVDLDDFKAVNDSLGHDTGDHLLRQVAERLRTRLRATDTVARLGGDEFAVLLEGADPGEVDAIAGGLVRLLARPFDVGRSVVTEASIGVAVARPDQSADELLRDADAAMYRAKADGKATWRRFDPSFHTDAATRLLLRSELQRGIDEEQFALHYQPIVDLGGSGEVILEALLRWTHPDRGPIPPAEFIPVAEDSGVIVPLGRWVLDTACAAAVGWTNARGRPPRVSVNVSTRQVQEPGFVGHVIGALAAAGLPADRLIVEITESVLIEGGAETIARLGALRRAGVAIALDDFGTGYSSLAYLQGLPVDILKIAQQFVERAGRSDDQRRLLTAIVNLGATMELTVVAEGVETSDQLTCLRRMRCDFAQGYHLATPMPVGDVQGWLDRRPADAAAPAGAAAPAPH